MATSADAAHPQSDAFAKGYSCAFDDFQVQACRAVADGAGVLVAAPTGAGKTIVGEFAVFLALATGRKAFYTTPLSRSYQGCEDFGKCASARAENSWSAAPDGLRIEAWSSRPRHPGRASSVPIDVTPCTTARAEPVLLARKSLTHKPTGVKYGQGDETGASGSSERDRPAARSARARRDGARCAMGVSVLHAELSAGGGAGRGRHDRGRGWESLPRFQRGDRGGSGGTLPPARSGGYSAAGRGGDSPVRGGVFFLRDGG